MELTKLMTQVKNSRFVNELTDYSDVFFVGGCCRDLFLNKDPKDIDIVVCGLSEQQLVDILKNYGKVELVGESFGCFKFKPFDFHVDEPIDIALARKERKTGNGHKGFEMEIDPNFTIFDDLGRRDFTFNSIAIDIMTGEVIDPFDGLYDLHAGLIRCVNPNAFVEDPLRIMRALQFAARFGFEIEAATYKMMLDNKEMLSFSNKEALAGERILDEIKKVWDKDGDLTKFINISQEFICAMFDKKCDGFQANKPSKPFGIFEDFFKLIFFFSAGEYDLKENVLKLENKSVRALEVMTDLIDVDVMIMRSKDEGSTVEVDIDLELMKVYKKDFYNFNSLFFPKDLKTRFEFLKKNDLAVSLKELDKLRGINGNTLMAKGFKGKELGDELERLLLLEMKSLD